MTKKGAIQKSDPVNTENLEDHIALNGTKNSIFQTIGRWQTFQEIRDRRAPVLVPWFVIDIDHKDEIDRAHEQADQIARQLDWLDPARVIVSLSGGKGFHVELHASLFMEPLEYFADSDIAHRTVQRVITEGLGITGTDPATHSPLTLIRLTGSRHTLTALYKTTWQADDFVGRDFSEIMHASIRFRPFERSRRTGPVNAKARQMFVDAATAYTPPRKMPTKRGGMKAIGPALKRALSGVGEEQAWAETKTGRDWACFTILQYCWENERQHKAVRSFLGLNPRGDIEETMNVWNKRNSPPLAWYVIEQKLKRNARS